MVEGMALWRFLHNNRSNGMLIMFITIYNSILSVYDDTFFRILQIFGLANEVHGETKNKNLPWNSGWCLLTTGKTWYDKC